MAPGTVFVLDSLPGDTLYFEYTKSTKVVPIKTNQSDWAFSIVEGKDFCSARKSGGIAVSVTENELMAARTAEITLSAEEETRHIVVRQKEANPFFRLSVSQVEFNGAVSDDNKEWQTIPVTVAANFQWGYVSTPVVKWLSFDAPEKKSLRSNIEITCIQSTDTARTVEVTFTATDTTYQKYIGEKNITITQQGK